MGAGSLSGARLPRACSSRPPGTTARLRARLHSHSLDRDFAAGIAGWRSPAHAARALYLTGPKYRKRLAQILESLLDDVRRPAGAQRLGAVPACRASIEATEPQIRALASRLRADVPLAPAGIARLHMLLCDGAGPIYVRGRATALSSALTMVAQWLDVEE
jgi:hypothetical protein